MEMICVKPVTKDSLFLSLPPRVTLSVQSLRIPNILKSSLDLLNESASTSWLCGKQAVPASVPSRGDEDAVKINLTSYDLFKPDALTSAELHFLNARL